MRRDLPEPPEAGLLNALRFGSDTLRFLEGLQARYPDAVAVPVPGRAPLVVVTGPDLIHDALDRPAEFGRITPGGPTLPAENGLVQTEGELWRQQRGIMAPAFAGRRLRAYGDAVGERAESLVDRLAGAAETGKPVDLHREATSLTVRVASEILLGEDIGHDRAARFHDWMRTTTRELAISPSGVAPEWVPTRTSDAYETAAAGMQELCEELIERRRETDPDPGGDMLGLLLAAEDDPEVEYPPNQIRDEVLTFLIAGHETTALSLTYALALLSWHPEARERVRAEARAALGPEVLDGPETAGYDHAADLAYTERVFREAMRLYPAAWAVFREATAEVRLGEYRVPAGAGLIMPQWSVHRDARHFEAPERFDPDRWTRRDPNAVDAYFPFGSGPHACIGRGFALTGATVALARIVGALDLDVSPDALEELRPSVTLRPRDGVAARVTRRTAPEPSSPAGGRAE